MNVLDELAEVMARAAEQLERGNQADRTWAAHLRSDRKSILLRALTFAPDDLVTNGRTQ